MAADKEGLAQTFRNRRSLGRHVGRKSLHLAKLGGSVADNGSHAVHLGRYCGVREMGVGIVSESVDCKCSGRFILQHALYVPGLKTDAYFRVDWDKLQSKRKGCDRLR